MTMYDDESKFMEKYKHKVVKDCLTLIYKNHRVVDDDGYDIELEVLHQLLLSPKIKTVPRCIGTTSSTPISQCSRNAIGGSQYCKKHMYNIGLSVDKMHTDNVSFYVKKRKPEQVCESQLTKKFIEDTFYYIDKYYIYDINKEKVGYIENGNCILTSDPFILGML